MFPHTTNQAYIRIQNMQKNHSSTRQRNSKWKSQHFPIDGMEKKSKSNIIFQFGRCVFSSSCRAELKSHSEEYKKVCLSDVERKIHVEFDAGESKANIERKKYLSKEKHTASITTMKCGRDTATRASSSSGVDGKKRNEGKDVLVTSTLQNIKNMRAMEKRAGA